MFYVAVVLLAARFWQAPGVLLVSVGCMALTVVAFLVAPASVSASTAVINTGLQSQSAEVALRERTSLLDLTHDSIFARSMNDAITYWDRGAEVSAALSLARADDDCRKLHLVEMTCTVLTDTIAKAADGFLHNDLPGFTRLHSAWRAARC